MLDFENVMNEKRDGNKYLHMNYLGNCEEHLQNKLHMNYMKVNH